MYSVHRGTDLTSRPGCCQVERDVWVELNQTGVGEAAMQGILLGQNDRDWTWGSSSTIIQSLPLERFVSRPGEGFGKQTWQKGSTS